LTEKTRETVDLYLFTLQVIDQDTGKPKTLYYLRQKTVKSWKTVDRHITLEQFIEYRKSGLKLVVEQLNGSLQK